MKYIQITKGYQVAVDDGLFDELNRYKWCAQVNKLCVYAVRRDYSTGKQVKIFMHRMVCGISDEDKRMIDHIDGDTLNNQRANLRPCTRRQNALNCRVPKHNTSGYKGVSYDPRFEKYRAYIKINIGKFDNPVEAAKAYDRKAKELFGEFARLNFPNG